MTSVRAAPVWSAQIKAERTQAETELAELLFGVDPILDRLDRAASLSHFLSDPAARKVYRPPSRDLVVAPDAESTVSVAVMLGVVAQYRQHDR